MSMTLDELMNKLAKELPYTGADIRICVEHGGAWVEAVDHDGASWDADNSDASFEERALDALEWIKSRQNPPANAK